MEKEQLIKALMEYPEKLAEGLRTYHQAKRKAERLEAQLAEKDEWPSARRKSDEVIGIEQQLSAAKGEMDIAEEGLAVLQTWFEVNKVLARAGLYTG